MERFLSKKEVRQIVGLSPTQFQRLEGEHRFPKRVRLGAYRTSRCVYLLSEVEAWMKKRISERDRPTD